MVSPQAPFYRVLPAASGRQEMRQLGERAHALGIRQRYLDAFRQIEQNLRSDPLNWGDPLYTLRHLNLAVYHRCHDLVCVTYAVNQTHRVVWITHAIPMPGFPLDAGP